MALGAVTNFYHTPGLEEHALTMKTPGDAIVYRNRIIDALELADNQLAEDDRRKTLTVVVAGGGFAGNGAERFTAERRSSYYPLLNNSMLSVVVVHLGDHILPELGESLGRYALKKPSSAAWRFAGRRGLPVTTVRKWRLDDGTKIPSRMLIWTAGITPSPLVSSLPWAHSEAASLQMNVCKKAWQVYPEQPELVCRSWPRHNLPWLVARFC